MIKYLYVLTSQEKDFYYEQALLSIMSLRLHNPNAHISLLVDNLTFKTLKRTREKLLELVQEYKVVDFSDIIPLKVRSRMLKTNMRNLIDGDLLYIDCDTVIVDALDIPQDWSFDIGAVKNLHCGKLTESPSYHSFKYNADKCNISINSEDYFNGGVLYIKDIPITRKFFSHWNALYVKYLNTQGIDIDQLSLYETNCDFRGIIKELSGEWNWQVGFEINHFANAKIMHILTTTFIERKREINSIHLLQRKYIYQNIKNQTYTESNILQIIKDAKISFDKTARITPVSFDIDSLNQSITDFCAKNKHIYLYIDAYFDIVIFSVLEQLKIKISGYIVPEKNDNKHFTLDIPTFSVDELSFSPQEVGVLIATKFPQINQVLPLLISHNIFNLFILK
jgi:hypothetical protein